MSSQRIETIIAKMTSEEKVAQLCGVYLRDLLEGRKLSREKCRKLIPNGIGHICQFASCTDLLPEEAAAAIAEIQKYIQEVTLSKVPALVHEEALTGVAARGAAILPQMIGMSCSWDPRIVCKNAGMTAENMKKMGCYHALSPMMDVITDARWGRGEEGCGEEAYLVSEFSLAFIEGLQKSGVAATAKHFAGYGIDNQEMSFFRNEVLIPFEAAVKKGGVKAIMPGYHKFHNIPSAASSFLIGNVLRKEWGFEGIVVSDYNAVAQIKRRYHYALTRKKAAIAALKAGTDLDIPNGECYIRLVKAVKKGKISEELVNTSLRRVLALKEELGVLDIKPEKANENIDLDSPEYREQALKSAHEAIVLLKNNGVLPLENGRQKIAVVGPNANSYYSLQGDYTWMGIHEYFYGEKTQCDAYRLVTLLAGLKNRMKNAQIEYERGCDWSKTSKGVSGSSAGDDRGKNSLGKVLEDVPPTDPEKALALAESSDIIIAAMGENRFLCGECCDRSDVRLPGEQEKFVSKLCETGKPVILVIFGGRPMAIADIAEKCAAVIYAWYPGEEGGNAAADIILGNVNPSAKLTVSMPDTADDAPFSYHQWDRAGKFRYPFGFGLSYTNFSYSSLSPDKAELTTDDEFFDITFSVSNNGDRPGTEISQIYLSSKKTPKKLIGHAKTRLEPGEKKTVKIRFFLDSFAKYDAEGILHLPPFDFTLQIGASAADIRLSAPISVKGKEKILGTKEHFFSENL